MPQARVIHKSYQSMNSVLDIVLPNIDRDTGEIICNQIWQIASDYELMLSCYNDKAEVFQVNKNAFAGKFQVSSELAHILSECKYFHKLTRGYFDVGLKRLMTETFDATKDIGIETIEINEENRTVRFWSEHTAIDLGGIGKGIVLREANRIFSQFNISNCFVSFGGSSILTRGSHPNGNSWPLSVREGMDTDFIVQMNNHAASFSESHVGDTQKSHVINPKTGMQEINRRFTFVQTHCPVVAEVLSTTLVVAPLNEVEEIVTASKALKAIIFKNSDQQNITIEYQYGK